MQPYPQSGVGPMTTRAVEKLIDRYVKALGLDPNVTVHSLRVTAPDHRPRTRQRHHRLQDSQATPIPGPRPSYIRSLTA